MFGLKLLLIMTTPGFSRGFQGLLTVEGKQPFPVKIIPLYDSEIHPPRNGENMERN